MQLIKALVSFFVSMILSIPGIKCEKTIQKAEDFRVTAYVVGSGLTGKAKPSEHFATITDAILIGVASFDENGNIVLADDFGTVVSNLRILTDDYPVNVYLNLGGPGAEGEFSDWNEQMESQSVNHEKAFASGNLEENIRQTLEEYGFDGVFFDYEYALTKAHWNRYCDFLVSLDKVLGDGFRIGYAASAWNAQPTRESLKVTDMVEVMSYDLWEDDGTHASVRQAKKDIRDMLLKGYAPEQLDLGIPFYARPTTHEAYWYGYGSYCGLLDENGLFDDEATGLTFSFNTAPVVYEKTNYALTRGLGGVMIWHYACDTDPGSELSLFGSIGRAKQDIIEKYSK